MVLLAAVSAEAVNLEGMAGGGVMMLAADFLLEAVHLGREELDRTAALGANHVMVAAPVVLVLIAGDAVVERDFAGQPAFRQQLESAIDRGEADASVFFLYQAMQFVRG